MQCLSCATELPAGSRFCPSCGQPIAPPSQLMTSPGAAIAVGVNRLVSSEAIPVGGLTPGSMIAGRYRIIGLLGRGGMGEVYRADDVRLGQTVALKFLPREMSADPVWRERFFAEVRITRQLSHPNICRVYDIGDWDGRHFLSMEFIDGEDLASLLRRIGHLSNEKAVAIARQLAAGLAVAHERGVLHRDLKPANIMIDGHGRARITDFGLAVGAASDHVDSEMAGTPAYMAPEQLAGKAASVRSDIYAMGLVLYEVYCGRPAFSARTLAELRDQKEHSTPAPPSAFRPDIDPIVDRLIVRCLERDPRARPASVTQLAGSLPGGDPLAAAIAAGETPSPELVAASGLKEGLAPPVAAGLLAVVAIASLVAAWLGDRVGLAQNAGLSKTPDALVERAHIVLEKAGYTEAAFDRGSGFYSNDDVLQYVVREYAGDARAKALQSLGAVSFFYRQSPVPLVSPSIFSGVDPGEPPLLREGDLEVRLDAEGRLRSFFAVPIDGDEPPSGPDWRALFAETGLDWAQWTAVPPARTPRVFADTRLAWEGAMPDTGGKRARIEGAAYKGRAVTFDIIGPWRSDGSSDSARAGASGTPAATLPASVRGIATIVGVVILLTGVFFARQNLRAGRGDRRGALRLTLFGLTVSTVSWLLVEHHVASADEGRLYVVFAGISATFSAVVLIFYTALEPFVRRRWPQMLVSWARLVSGSWRDPLVGRDVLIGCAAGVVTAILTNFSRLIAATAGGALFVPDWNMFDGTRSMLGAMAGTTQVGAFNGLVSLFILFLLRVILRRDWAAISVFVLLSGARYAVSFAGVVLPIIIVIGAIRALVLIRFGLIAEMVTSLVWTLFMTSPMTLDTSAWYAGPGYATAVFFGAIATYGFTTALGGRSLLEPAAIGG
jgi:hypothetical protein